MEDNYISGKYRTATITLGVISAILLILLVVMAWFFLKHNKTIRSSKAVVMSELAKNSQEEIAEKDRIEDEVLRKDIPEENITKDVRQNTEQVDSGSNDIALKESLGDSQDHNLKVHLM